MRILTGKTMVKGRIDSRKGLETLLGGPVAFGLIFLVFTGIASAGGGGVSGGGGGGGGTGGGVPEIDAGSALSALTVLGGGLLLVTDRLRKRRSSR